MENRGTGLKVQTLPAEWMKSKIDMSNTTAQGPSQDMRPTSRALNPGASFTESTIRSRPGAMFGEQRAQAPIPSEVITVLDEAPGGYITQTIAGGGSFDTEIYRGEGGGNVSTPVNDVDFGRGSATRTTGRTVIGQTSGKGTI